MADGRARAVLKVLRGKFFAGVEAILFAAVLALLSLIAFQVLTRYALQMSVVWTEEVARMVLVWVAMLGAAVAMERKAHYAINMFLERVDGVTKMALLIATNIIGLVFLVVLVVYGAEFAWVNSNSVSVSTQVSRAWIYLAVPVGGTIMGLSLMLHSIDAWFDWRKDSASAKAPRA